MKLPWYRQEEKLKLGDSVITIVLCQRCGLPYVQSQRCKICYAIKGFARLPPLARRGAADLTGSNGGSAA
jgi:hypothetical protein